MVRCAGWSAAPWAQLHTADRDRRVAGVLKRAAGAETREVGRRPVRTLLASRFTAATVAGVVSGNLVIGDVVDCDGNVDQGTGIGCQTHRDPLGPEFMIRRPQFGARHGHIARPPPTPHPLPT